MASVHRLAISSNVVYKPSQVLCLPMVSATVLFLLPFRFYRKGEAVGI